MLTFGSLFAGIGGMDEGLERAGMEVKWQVEIDDYATRVLEKDWPNVRRWRDVRTFPPEPASEWRVDLIAGGFPCQDISYAGTGAGIDGERSGLWREFARIICVLRPRFVLIENSPALLVRGLDRVLCDLAGSGFDAEWSPVSACSMGCTHMRRRLFVVAYSNGVDGKEGLRRSIAQAFRSLQQVDSFESARASYKARLENPSELYRDADGVPNRKDRNRVLGNSVCPDVAQFIASRIIAANP